MSLVETDFSFRWVLKAATSGVFIFVVKLGAILGANRSVIASASVLVYRAASPASLAVCSAVSKDCVVPSV